MMKTKISEPLKRGRLRRLLGKEYYRARRAVGWRVDALLGRKVWARQVKYKGDIGGKFFENVVFEHKTVILRKLAGVDMQLQENKRRNLELAIAHLYDVMIRSGETFSIWKNVERPTRQKGYLVGLVLEREYRVEERNHLIRQQFWGGYSRHNEIVQVVTDREGNESERLLVKNDAIMMYAPLLEDRG